MASPISPDDRSQRIREKLEREFHCSHEDRAVAVKEQKNGVRYCSQCQRCGEFEMLRAGDLAQSEKAGAIPFDKGIKERWWKARSSRAGDLYDQDREQEKAEFDRWYQSYLTTPEWRIKRDAVLKRAGHMCEGCLKWKATEVHHLTYVRVGREMLFDLVAVCEICHREIHDPDSVEQDDEEEWDPSWDDEAPPF
ncbi:MAG: hypothetical protein CMO55_17530 [Verrucomicrobiales bacterium]|nr:hypothetical protein [Verrucomicrobiales bacterium]